MKIDIDIERSLILPVTYARAEPLLHDLDGTIRRFPKLKKLTRLDERSYFWEMQTMGVRVAKIAHDLSYGARYSVDAKRGLLSWEPIPGKGNASIAGQIQIAPIGDQTRMSFKVHGTLNDLAVPFLYRPLALPFINGKFTKLIEAFLERTGQALGV